MGGTLALLAQNGADVDYLCATRGEGGEFGEPPLCSIEKLGDVRSLELHCAVHSLGGRSVNFLGYADPRVGPEQELFPYTNDLSELVLRLEMAIQQFKPEIILTHGSNGEYGHPAHVLSHNGVKLAVESIMQRSAEFKHLRLYTVQANFLDHPRPRLANKDDPADIILDIRPVINQKIEAALCHRTQNALFVRRASLQAGRQMTIPEVIMQVESLHRVNFGKDGQGKIAFEDILQKYQLK